MHGAVARILLDFYLQPLEIISSEQGPVCLPDVRWLCDALLRFRFRKRELGVDEGQRQARGEASEGPCQEGHEAGSEVLHKWIHPACAFYYG